MYVYRVQVIKSIIVTDDDYKVDAKYGTKVVKNQACIRIIVTYVEKFTTI